MDGFPVFAGTLCRGGGLHEVYAKSQEAADSFIDMLPAADDTRPGTWWFTGPDVRLVPLAAPVGFGGRSPKPKMAVTFRWDEEQPLSDAPKEMDFVTPPDAPHEFADCPGTVRGKPCPRVCRVPKPGETVECICGHRIVGK